MLSVVLEVSVAIRGQLSHFLLRRNEVFKYCFANKGQVDVWIIGRDPIPEAKRKRDHFRRIYEFLYRKEQTRPGHVPVWRTVEGCDDRGPMQEIRERLGMVSEPPEADSLLKDAVVKDVMLWSCSSEESAKRDCEEGEEFRKAEEPKSKRLKCEEKEDTVTLRRLNTLSKLLRLYVKEMLEGGSDYDSLKKIQEGVKDCDSVVNEVLLNKYGLPEGLLFRDYNVG